MEPSLTTTLIPYQFGTILCVEITHDEIDLDNVRELQKAIVKAIDDCHEPFTNLTISCIKLKFVDSQFVQMLLILKKRLTEDQKIMVVCQNRALQRIFKLALYRTGIRFYETLAEITDEDTES